MVIVLPPTLVFATMSTPIGPLTILTADDRVVAGGFTDSVDLVARFVAKKYRGAPMERVDHRGPIGEALTRYFDGDVAALDSIPIQVQGGRFQEQVWAALRQIPPGQPTTYRDLAIKLGGQRLARAVGMANATNPIAPIVPCHRVTGTSGDLTGYYWGLERKRWLLDHERRHAQGR